MPEDRDFPMTYDQYQRYSVLREFLVSFYFRTPPTVLDVGGLSADRTGKTHFLPVKNVVLGKATVIDTTFCPIEDFVQADGIQLPFKNQAFAVVSALDVIEHIPPDNRNQFIQELCRVSQDSVIISAPFQNKQLESVEDLLFSQLKAQYDVEQQQLREHKQYGLPEIETVSLALSQYMPAGLSFAYGSLKNWLYLMSIKNCFMLKKSTGKIHYFLDKWLFESDQASEFEGPFSRYFWIYSRNIRQGKLEKGLKRMQKALGQSVGSMDLEDIKTFHRALLDYTCQDHITALIISEGETSYLVECLNHALTQKISNDLEIAVWDIARDNEVKRLLQNRFPGVRYYVSDKSDKLPNAFYKILFRLRGDYILLLSDNILLPSNSASHFYTELKNKPQASALFPRIICEENDSANEGECLFIRKEAQFDREWASTSLSGSDIFLWNKTEASGEILSCPQFTVYKK